MPVSFAKSRERPRHGVPRQPTLDVGILQDVRRIIEVNELVMDDGIVESKSGRHQQETESDDVGFAGRGRWLEARLALIFVAPQEYRVLRSRFYRDPRCLLQTPPPP